jgi:hypothetical protein
MSCLPLFLLPSLSLEHKVIDESKITPEWLAGFFDGEGCVCLQMSRNAMHLRINITQADEELLKAIEIKYGASYMYPKPRKNQDGQVYEVGWTGRNCKAIIEVLDGRVVKKQSQIDLALQFLATMVGQGNRLTDEQVSERESLRQQMRDLNHAGPFKPRPYIAESKGVTI